MDPMQKIEYLIVHHTGRHNDFPLFIKLRHIYLRKWEDIGYHYLIGNSRLFTKDGKIYNGRPETIEGAHTKGYNKNSLGICLIGNFDKKSPSQKQIKTLLRFLVQKKEENQIPIKNILGHHETFNSQKTCPGKMINMDYIREQIKLNQNYREF